MKSLLLTLAALSTLCLTASGEMMTFTDKNFAIDIPPELRQVPPPVPEIVLATQSSDRKRTFLAAVAALPDRELADGAGQMLAGIKKSYEDAGLAIQSEKQTTVGDLPFLVLEARNPSTHISAAAYTIVAGKNAYALQFLSQGDEAAMSDPVFQKTLSGFHFITPAEIHAGETRSAGYRIGFLVGRAMSLALLPALLLLCLGGLVWYFWKEGKRRR